MRQVSLVAALGKRSMSDEAKFYSVQETDKATMDVEAQEDGIMAKIIVSIAPR